MPGEKWTEEQEQYLRDNAPSEELAQLCFLFYKEFKIARRTNAMKMRLKKLGLYVASVNIEHCKIWDEEFDDDPRKRWTEAQMEFLRYWRSKDHEWLAKELSKLGPERTSGGVKSKLETLPKPTNFYKSWK